MSVNKVWFITGAGRGMGLDITKSAPSNWCSVIVVQESVQ